jgi:Cu+-exporting ATPase
MAELVKDPVCNMDVDPDTAAAKSEHQGTAYYFCAEGCKQSFDADPHKFLGGGEAPAAQAAPAAEQPAEAPAGEAPPKRWWEFWKS